MRDRLYDYESSFETEKTPDMRETHDTRQNRGKKENKLSKIHLNSDATIDFEELVERVKKRLEKELKDKLAVTKDNKKYIDETRAPKVKYMTTRKQVEAYDDKSEYIDEITDRTTKYRPNKKKMATTERYEYADALETNYSNNRNKNRKKTTKEKDYGDFKKIEMINDSYEDYKTPSKDTNIYSSKEGKTFKTPSKDPNIHSSKEGKRFKIKNSSVTREVVRKPLKLVKAENTRPVSEEFGEEVKARTENIAYDDDLSSPRIRNLKLGTNKPTREVYTIVTPNYVSPVGAERYDFDEPIPEKDREREHLKYIGNPPARINKKVLL